MADEEDKTGAVTEVLLLPSISVFVVRFDGKDTIFTRLMHPRHGIIDMVIPGYQADLLSRCFAEASLRVSPPGSDALN